MLNFQIEQIKGSTKRLYFILNGIADTLRRKEYYADLSQEDIASNIEILFGEIEAIHHYVYEATEEIVERCHDIKPEIAKSKAA